MIEAILLLMVVALAAGCAYLLTRLHKASDEVEQLQASVRAMGEKEIAHLAMIEKLQGQVKRLVGEKNSLVGDVLQLQGQVKRNNINKKKKGGSNGDNQCGV